jgi:F-type H+-transporting ATPase subunit gamma
MKEFDAQGKKFQATCIGNKGFGFMQRVGAKVVSHVTGLWAILRTSRS